MGFSGRFRHLKELLPSFLEELGAVYQERGEEILASWPAIVGNQLAPMTEAVSFREGILSVKVKNSTLYSILNGPDKALLLKKLREKFPQSSIRGINFRLS